MVSGALTTCAPPSVTIPFVLAIIKPAAFPDKGNVGRNSAPVVWSLLPLYCKVAEAAYASVPVTVVVAVPSIDRTPYTVVVPD